MTRARRLQIFLAILLSLVGGYSHGYDVQMDNLYTVVIQVTDNNIATRNKHLPQAFEQVIKKVASSNHVLHHQEYINAREHLDRFVNHYFFTEDDGDYTLTLRFNEQMINRLVAKMGRTTLGKTRQQVLLWLVTQQNNNAQFVAYEVDGTLAHHVDRLALDYGVPIILPLLDLTERVFIRERDVLDFNVRPLQQAAERYNTSTILLGKAQSLAGIWHCEWRLIDGDQNISWTSNSPDLKAELEQMINRLADQMVAQKHNMQQQTTKLATGITVRVNGITSVADYTKVFDHLKRLSLVQQVDAGSMDGDQATFVVKADGGAIGLSRALQMDTVLVSDLSVLPNPLDDAANSLNLTYKVNS
ncbi:MAG TPA: DUF2066 domain-containing protein [Gammaproteobacteria bacterium]|nr:DUF2066 domain-containing protein [Gammaproteobacteria bacterium]